MPGMAEIDPAWEDSIAGTPIGRPGWRTRTGRRTVEVREACGSRPIRVSR